MVHKSHSILGWVFEEDVPHFASETLSLEHDQKSDYDGQYKIKPQGKQEDYIKMMREQVSGTIPMEAVASMAAAATVLPILNYWLNASISNPIISIIGNSTKGKSTACDMAVSFGCSAERGSESLTLTFCGTQNSIFKDLAKNQGYPVSIDEFSMSDTGKISRFIYQLADGNEKSRLTSSCTQAERGRWQTVCFVNGENSLLDAADEKEGLRARVFEFEEILWTKDSAHAEAISTVIQESYGWITPMIGGRLLELGKEDVGKLYRKWLRKVKADIKARGMVVQIQDRIAKVVALFLTAGEILSSVLNVEFHIDQVYEFFFEHIIEKAERDSCIGKRAYAFMKDYFVNNKMKFIDLSVSDGHNPSNPIGLIRSTRKFEGQGFTSSRAFCITKEKAREILVKGKFPDLKVVMNSMNELGLLITKQGLKRSDYVFEFLNERVVGYCIRLMDEESSEMIS